MSRYSNEPPATPEGLTAAIKWIARHRTGDDGQEHELLSILFGAEWARKNPAPERNDGG